MNTKFIKVTVAKDGRTELINPVFIVGIKETEKRDGTKFRVIDTMGGFSYTTYNTVEEILQMIRKTEQFVITNTQQ